MEQKLGSPSANRPSPGRWLLNLRREQPFPRGESPWYVLPVSAPELEDEPAPESQDPPSSAVASPVPGARARKLGARLAIAFYALVVGGFTAICAVQILIAVWWPPLGPAASSCRAGLKDLIDGVEEARLAAAQATSEREAVQRFRDGLGPGWSRRQSVGALCETDPAAKRTLKLVDRLRFAEEHAVRYEASDVAGLRQRVRKEQQDLQL